MHYLLIHHSETMGVYRLRTKGSKSKSKKLKKQRYRREKVAFNDNVEIIQVETLDSDDSEIEVPVVLPESVSPRESLDRDPTEQELQERDDPKETPSSDSESSTSREDPEFSTARDDPETKVTETCNEGVYKVVNAFEFKGAHDEVLQRAHYVAQKIIRNLEEEKDSEAYAKASKNIQMCVNAHKMALERVNGLNQHAALFKPCTSAKVALDNKENARIKKFPTVFSRTVQKHLLFTERVARGRFGSIETNLDKVGTKKVESTNKAVDDRKDLEVNEHGKNIERLDGLENSRKNSTLTQESIKPCKCELVSDEGSLIGGLSTQMPSEDWDKITRSSSSLSFNRIDSIHSLSSISSYRTSVKRDSGSLFSKVYGNFKRFCRDWLTQENLLQNPFSSCMLCCA